MREDCRRGFLIKMITPIEQCPVPSMETFEVNGEFQEDMIEPVNKEKRGKVTGSNECFDDAF